MTGSRFVPARSRVGHNALLNFVGLATPLGLAFFVMPIAARNLGAARFGLLGLAWAVTEYLTLFDLGLGRALVKFVADTVHDTSTALSEIVSVSMIAQLTAGLVGGAAFAAAAPLLVHNVFRVSPDISGEAVSAFRVVGLSVPVVLLMSGQRSVLEGAQRFDLSATLKMAGSIASLVIPAIGAVLGWSLPKILLIVLVARVGVSVLYAVAIRHAIPHLRWKVTNERGLLGRVLSFGGWVLVSNAVSPLLVYFDRFALGTIVGLTAVGLYTAPYEGTTRLLLIPASLVGSLLPALTSLAARGDRDRLVMLAGSSERLLATVMAPPLALIAVFAPELLTVWLGAPFALHSSTALRLLAVGVFVNSLANPLFVMLYAMNRPDLPAKFHLTELAVHVPLTILLIQRFGISGAAAGWTIRATLDAVLLLVGAVRTSGRRASEILGDRFAPCISAVVILVVALGLTRVLATISVLAAAFGVLGTLVVFALFAWRWVLAISERAALSGTLRSTIAILSRRAAPG